MNKNRLRRIHRDGPLAPTCDLIRERLTRNRTVTMGPLYSVLDGTGEPSLWF